MTTPLLPRELEPHYQRLVSVLQKHGRLIVAYSGGVDSGFLAYAARRVLGSRVLCVLAVSPSLAEAERRCAVSFLERHEIPFECLSLDETKDERYRANTPDRCYYCKSGLFAAIQAMPAASRFSRIAYGANVDDFDDFRPGSRAAAEKEIVAPLVEAGYTKDLIRETARAFGLELWDKPAAPCLASRIPYYTEVTAEKLRQVETAEMVLRDEGFRVCRVRHQGELARVEVPKQDFGRLLEESMWPRIEAGIKRAGFRRVELEPEGFRSGRLNDAIDDGRGS